MESEELLVLTESVWDQFLALAGPKCRLILWQSITEEYIGGSTAELYALWIPRGWNRQTLGQYSLQFLRYYSKIKVKYHNLLTWIESTILFNLFYFEKELKIQYQSHQRCADNYNRKETQYKLLFFFFFFG